MRENYNYANYWKSIIYENGDLIGHAFMKKLPTSESVYFHTLMFNKGNGINNIWGYFPNIRSLIGYIQHSFLQEAFYKWIYGKEKLITKLPHTNFNNIIDKAENENRITREVALKMREDYNRLNMLWGNPIINTEKELKKFICDFNKKWMGDNKEFLYIRYFRTPEELGEFVIKSSLMSETEEELEQKIGVTIEDWRNICKNSLNDNLIGKEFKNILCKKLSQIF